VPFHGISPIRCDKVIPSFASTNVVASESVTGKRRRSASVTSRKPAPETACPSLQLGTAHFTRGKPLVASFLARPLTRAQPIVLATGPPLAPAQLVCCDVDGCSRAYNSVIQLAVHKRTHRFEHRCFYCTGTFMSGSELTRHVRRVHRAERPFACTVEGCGKAFTAKGNRAAHAKAHNSVERAFKCDYDGCGKSFYIVGNLNAHKRTHSGVRPFICTFEGCGKAFTVSSHLTVHRRSHSGERPYTCTFEGCKRAYVSSGGLAQHRKKRSHFAAAVAAQ
jgi:hypothetical protein